MAQIHTGGSGYFDSLFHGELHPGARTFIQRQMEAPSRVMENAAQQFQESSQALFERLSGSGAMRMARAAKRAVGAAWMSNQIQALLDIGQMQHAPAVMQRYIMAEPTLRKRYHQQRLDGYEGTYRDLFPEDIGEEHYDYRRVMDGIVVENDDGSWYADTFVDDLLPDDDHLDIDQQVDILDTWANMVAKVRQGGSDPTSKWNASL